MTAESKRASVFETDDDDGIDVSLFAPKAAPDPAAPSADAVRAVSEDKFPSRERPKTPAKPVKAPEPIHDRRKRTGRNKQLNVKARQEAVDAFYAIVDKQGWTLGETLEYAVDRLDKAVKAGWKPGAQ
jgi:hypothetical protein